MDAVDILVIEYRTLREESLARLKARWATVGFLGAVAAWAATSPGLETEVGWPVAALAALFLTLVWYRQGINLARLSSRLAEIESSVNGLYGQRLLCWHSDLDDTEFARWYPLRPHRAESSAQDSDKESRLATKHEVRDLKTEDGPVASSSGSSSAEK